MTDPLRVRIIAVASSLIVVLWVWLPFLEKNELSDPLGDWRMRVEYNSYAVASIFEKHEIPYWTTSERYDQLRTKGYHTFFSNPETEVLSPYILFYRWLPYMDAIRTISVIHLLVGVIGLTLLANLYGITNIFAVVLLNVVLFSSRFLTSEVQIGHFQFISFTYFPLILYFILKKRSDRTTLLDPSTIGAGGLMALSFYEGNAHLLLHFLITSSIFVLVQTGLNLKKRSPASAASPYDLLSKYIGALFWFTSIACAKFLPGLIEYSAYRKSSIIRYESVFGFFSELITPHTGELSGWQSEAPFYIGIPATILLIISFITVRRNNLAFAIAAISGVVLAFAPFPEFLKMIPILKSQILFDRFRGMFLLWGIMTVISGNRLNLLRTTSNPLLVNLVLIGSLLYSTWNYHGLVTSTFNQSPFFRLFLHDVEFVAPTFVPVKGKAEEVEASSLSVNSFTYKYTPKENSNAPQILVAPKIRISRLRASVRTVPKLESTSYHHKLAFILPPGQKEFTLYCWPTYLTISICVSVIALLSAVSIFARNACCNTVTKIKLAPCKS